MRADTVNVYLRGVCVLSEAPVSRQLRWRWLIQVGGGHSTGPNYQHVKERGSYHVLGQERVNPAKMLPIGLYWSVQFTQGCTGRILQLQGTGVGVLTKQSPTCSSPRTESRVRGAHFSLRQEMSTGPEHCLHP